MGSDFPTAYTAQTFACSLQSTLLTRALRGNGHLKRPWRTQIEELFQTFLYPGKSKPCGQMSPGYPLLSPGSSISGYWTFHFLPAQHTKLQWPKRVGKEIKNKQKKEKKGKKKKCEGTFNLLSEKEKKKNSKAVINGMLRLCIKPIKVKKIKRN